MVLSNTGPSRNVTPVSRLRARASNFWVNQYIQPGGGFSNTINQIKEDSIDDLGYPHDHLLSLTRDTVSGCEVDWLGAARLVGKLGNEMPRPNSESATISSFLSPLDAQRIAVLTAPERPLVNTITNLLEIREIPRMLLHAGDLLHRLRRPLTLTEPGVIASTTLAYQFGWAPLVQDLRRVVDFGHLVSRRLQEIGALNSGKEIRKKVQLGSTNGSYRSSLIVHSVASCLIQPSIYTSWSVKAWGTIHWKLADLNRLGKQPTWWWAFRSVYGLSAAEIPIQIWKSLPWSWMIDWFTGFSDALEVSKNLITYSPSRINRMHTIVQSYQYEKLQPSSNRKFSGGTRVRIVKNRLPLSIGGVTGLRLRVPFMDTFKLSVLSALTVVKLRGRALR